MRTYRIFFSVDYPCSNIEIEANSSEEAEEKFSNLTWGDIENMSADFPDPSDIEIDDIDEVKEL